MYIELSQFPPSLSLSLFFFNHSAPSHELTLTHSISRSPGHHCVGPSAVRVVPTRSGVEILGHCWRLLLPRPHCLRRRRRRQWQRWICKLPSSAPAAIWARRGRSSASRASTSESCGLAASQHFPAAVQQSASHASASFHQTEHRWWCAGDCCRCSCRRYGIYQCRFTVHGACSMLFSLVHL